MSVNKTITIENSFTLKMQNTTNKVKQISLFEQGSGDISAPISVNSANETAREGNLTQSALIWNFVAQQPFQIENPAVTSITTPININTIYNRTTGTLSVVSDNGGSAVSVSVSALDTLNEVNDKINTAIRNTATTSNFKSPSGKFAEVNVFFDFNYFNTFSLPQGMVGAVPYVQSWGVSVQYPSDLPHKLLDLNFPTNANPEFTTIDTMILSATSSANGITIDDTASTITYRELERSQSGQVLDVRSMQLDVGASPSENQKESQLLQPFCFTKYDVNGNELTYCKVKTKDPYQFQNSYQIVDMQLESDYYVLDGNTKFKYNLEPLTSLFLTFNYAQLTNLLFDTELGLKKAIEEQEMLTKYNKQKDEKRVLTLKTKPL